MKKSIITVILMYCFIVDAQIIGQNFPIENWVGKPLSGVYYKDNNNVFNLFEGTWLYSNNNTSLKIILKKREYVQKSNYLGKSVNYFQDFIVGEYQYIENGVGKINTLSNINSDNNSIYGDTILDNITFECDDCLPNEKRVLISFEDPITNMGGLMIIKKIVINHQEAIRVTLIYRGKPRTENEIAVQPTILPGVNEYDFILIKQ